MDKTIENIRHFLIDSKLMRKGQVVTDEQSLLESGIIDSLAVLELSTYLAKTYGVEINEDDLIPENFDSLAAMKAYVERKTTPKIQGR